MPDLKRIEREIRLCKSDKDSSVTVEPINDNLCHLEGLYMHKAKRQDVFKDQRTLAMLVIES